MRISSGESPYSFFHAISSHSAVFAFDVRPSIPAKPLALCPMPLQLSKVLSMFNCSNVRASFLQVFSLLESSFLEFRSQLNSQQNDLFGWSSVAALCCAASSLSDYLRCARSSVTSSQFVLLPFISFPHSHSLQFGVCNCLSHYNTLPRPLFRSERATNSEQ